MNDELPLSVQPIYWSDGLHEPLRLYEGNIRLRWNDQAIDARGSVLFTFLPSPGFIYDVTATPVDMFRLFASRSEEEERVELLDLHDSVPAQLPDGDTRDTDAPDSQERRSGRASSSGHLPRIFIGTKEGLHGVVFNLVNFSNYRGARSRRTNGASYRDRLTFEASPWRVTLDARRDLKETIEQLKVVRGYAFTHVGKLERIDRESFDWDEATDVLNGLFHFLSFAQGRLTSPALPIGIDKEGQTIAADWSARVVDPWTGRFCCLDLDHATELEQLFPEFMKYWTEPFWESVLVRAIRGYVDANNPSPLEGAVMMGQTTLELLAWAVLYEREGWLRKEEARITASGRLRLLLKWAGVSANIPETLSSLRELADSESWDGPRAVTAIRNALVHPTRETDRYLEVLTDCWMLTGWYQELAILRLLGFTGKYSNRLGSRWIGAVETVPWQVKPELGST